MFLYFGFFYFILKVLNFGNTFLLSYYYYYVKDCNKYLLGNTFSFCIFFMYYFY